jgi:hypothetical protein
LGPPGGGVGGGVGGGLGGTHQPVVTPLSAGASIPTQQQQQPQVAVEPSPELIQYWKDTLFDHCRHDRSTDLVNALNEGCPVDLMEEKSGDSPLMLCCRLGRTFYNGFL